MTQKKCLYAVLYLLIYVGAIRKYLISNQLLTLLPDFLILFVSLSLLLKKDVKKHGFKECIGTPACVVYIMLIGSSVLGAIFNSAHIMSYLWGLRVLLRYSLLVWIIYQLFTWADVLKYKKILYHGFIANLLFCLFQFMRGERGDFMTGTFEANGPLMLYCLTVFLVTSADYFCKQATLRKFLFVVSVLMLIAIWAEIKVMYFLFPLVLYSLYVFIKKFTLKLVLLLVAGFFYLIPTMKYFMSFYYDDDYVQQTFDAEFIEEETTHAYGFQEGGFNRSTAIEQADAVLLDTPIKKWFGNGLGSGSISSLFSTGYSDRYGYTTFWNFSTSYCLAEMGWTGFVLYCLFFSFIVIRFFSIYRQSSDGIIKYWTSIGIVSGLSTFLLAWYDDNVYYKYLPMYFLWGVCLVAIEQRKKEIAGKKSLPN